MLTISTKILTELVILIISVTVIPICGISVVTTLKSREFDRIIMIDFSPSFKNVMSLAFGYCVVTCFLSYAICLLYPDKFDIYEPQTLFPAVASSICLCFTARLIARIYGRKYGDQFISTLTASAAVIMVLNIIIAVNSWSTTINPNSSYILQVLKIACDSYFDFSKTIVIMLAENITFVYISAFLCAFVGELILTSVAPNNRSIMADFANFDNFFVPIDRKDVENVTKKMITCPNLTSIKLITKNFKVFEYDLDSLNNVDFKVIAPAPLNYPALSHEKFYNNRVEYLKEIKRFEYFMTLYSQNKLKWRNVNYDNLNIFMTNNKDLLLTVRSNWSETFLYSNNPYAVLQFVNFFDGYFNSI